MKLSDLFGKKLAPEYDLSKSLYRKEHGLLDQLEAEIRTLIKKGGTFHYSDLRAELPSIQSAIMLSKSDKFRIVAAMAERLAADRALNQKTEYDYDHFQRLRNRLIQILLHQQMTASTQETVRIFDLSEQFYCVSYIFSRYQIAAFALQAYSYEGISGPLKRVLLHYHDEFARRNETHFPTRDVELLRRQISLALAEKNIQDFPWDEPWQEAFLSKADRTLLAVAKDARGLAPSNKWLTRAEHVLRSEHGASFLHAFEHAMLAIRKMDVRVDSIHSDMLRGICWMAGQIKTERSAYLLGEMLLACNHKLSGQGARSQKGFNACVVALEQFGEVYALAELSKARAKVKTPSLAEMLFNSLSAAAGRQNIPLAELEELVVPAYDLEAPGLLRFQFGENSAELRIIGTADVELSWAKAGKSVKSAPSTVKQEYKSEIASISKRKREIESSLSAQKQRLESLFMMDRVWPFPLWRTRHIDHPLLAQMTRRLIWIFSSKKGDVLGICPQGIPMDIESNPIEGLNEETVVRLWHPLDAGISAIEAWREFLFTHAIVQPFKQAHREVYLLTDAERRTGIYSNRFAAHVLKQHQASALMRTRGWRYSLQGYFDAYNTPTLTLPALGLDAQYFLEVAPDPVDQDMSESGIALYVITDQVRFVRSNGGEAVNLEEIPAKILSEVFRDVDMFVGVSSVGNDPNWLDQGARPQYNEYWQKAAFGELNATAQTRKAILERLLPRLSIANVSRLDGKFLVVKGRIRTYKIHLGSSNILMMPNDQYLCIVPGAGRSDDHSHVFLPFEGDRTMAVILSKALMLAQDDKIKDPTIVSQLKR